MLADPQSITYNAVAKSLPAISRGTDASSYRLDDSGTVYTFTVLHQFKNRKRAVVRLQRDSYAPDPLAPSNYILTSMTATMTIDYPQVGLTSADAQLLGKALVGWLSDANILKVVNGET